MDNQQCNQKYELLWDSPPNLPKFVRERGFDFLCEIHSDSLLFVGINPSYQKDQINSHKTGNSKKREAISLFLCN